MLNRAELNDLHADIKQMDAEISELTRKAVLLYNVLKKINAATDELNKKAGALLDLEPCKKLFQNIFKAPN